MHALDISPVLEQFGLAPRPEQVSFLGQAGGLSGALFWRIATSDGEVCLRRWPSEHPSRERLQFIHAVLAHVAGEGIDFVAAPLRDRRGETIIEHAGHQWELTPWLAGRSDFELRPSRERLQQAMAALGRLHAALVTFPPSLGARGLPRGIADRTAQLRAIDDEALAKLAASIVEDDWHEAAERARQILVLCPKALDRVAERLRSVAALNVPLRPVLRDVWHQNVLFDGDRVTGIVDFGAMRTDHFAADLARLLGSMAADDVDAWRAGLAAYSQQRPFADSDASLLVAYDTSGILLGAWNWVQWLYTERRQFDDRSAVLRRLNHLLARLSRLADESRPTAAALAVLAR